MNSHKMKSHNFGAIKLFLLFGLVGACSQPFELKIVDSGSLGGVVIPDELAKHRLELNEEYETKAGGRILVSYRCNLPELIELNYTMTYLCQRESLVESGAKVQQLSDIVSKGRANIIVETNQDGSFNLILTNSIGKSQSISIDDLDDVNQSADDGEVLVL